MLTVSLFTLCLFTAAPAPLEVPPPRVVLRDRQFHPDRPCDKAFLNEQINLIRSDRVLKAVLLRPEVARLAIVRQQETPLEWLRAQMRVELDETTGSLNLTFRAGGRQTQALILTAVVEIILADAKAKNQVSILAQIARLEQAKMELEVVIVKDRSRFEKRDAEAKQRNAGVAMDEATKRDRRALIESWEADWAMVRAMEAEVTAKARAIERLRRAVNLPGRICVIKAATVTQ